MQLKELMDFVNLENERLIKYYNDHDLEKDKLILYRTVKLGEEFGELCDEILKLTASQRKEKLDKYTRDGLPEEFADVLITALLLAKVLDINVKMALQNKIEKINQRYKD